MVARLTRVLQPKGKSKLSTMGARLGSPKRSASLRTTKATLTSRVESLESRVFKLEQTIRSLEGQVRISH